jgi:DNA-binding XRE family transcriptional regulator
MLTTLQLRVSRSILDLGIRDIGSLLNTSRTTVYIWENKPNLSYINIKPDDLNCLKYFFEQKNIFFPDERTINLYQKTLIPINKNTLTRFQLKAARIALRLSQSELANYIGVLQQVIARAEILDNKEFVRIKNKEAIAKLLKFFQSNGVYFPNNLSIQFDDKIKD